MDKNSLALMERLKDSLLNNNYDMAEKILKDLTFENARGTIADLAYDTKNISTYTFVISLLLKKEKAELHLLASELLSTALFYLENAFAAGLYHARRCVELEPDNIGYKEFLLFFYGLPDQLMTYEEALKIAYNILRIKPTSQIALKVIAEQQ